MTEYNDPNLNKRPEQPNASQNEKIKQEQSKQKEVTKEDLEIDRLKKKIDELKAAKKQRIAKVKKQERQKREHRLIILGAEIEKMLGSENGDVIRKEMAFLLAYKKLLNEYGINTVGELKRHFEKMYGRE